MGWRYLQLVRWWQHVGISTFACMTWPVPTLIQLLILKVSQRMLPELAFKWVSNIVEINLSFKCKGIDFLFHYISLREIVISQYDFRKMTSGCTLVVKTAQLGYGIQGKSNILLIEIIKLNVYTFTLIIVYISNNSQKEEHISQLIKLLHNFGCYYPV